MNLEITKEINNIIQDYMAPGLWAICIGFKGDRATFDGEEMSSIEAVEKAYTRLIHTGVSCVNFSNGSWLKQVEYADLDTIMGQTEEDYYIDITIMNFLFGLKVVANECLKNPEDVVMAIIDNDSGCGCFYKNNEVMQLKDELSNM